MDDQARQRVLLDIRGDALKERVVGRASYFDARRQVAWAIDKASGSYLVRVPAMGEMISDLWFWFAYDGQIHVLSRGRTSSRIRFHGAVRRDPDAQERIKKRIREAFIAYGRDGRGTSAEGFQVSFDG